jgi:hypothetical protein
LYCRVRINTRWPTAGLPCFSTYCLVISLSSPVGGGQRAKAGTFEAPRDAPVARPRAEDHDAYRRRFAELKLKRNPASAVGRNQTLNGIRAEPSGRGRIFERGKPEGRPWIIDPAKKSLGGEGPALAKPRLALLSLGSLAPGLVLLGGELAPRLHDRAELSLRVLSGGGGLLRLRRMLAVVGA